jgi:replicative DNA helicase
VQFALRPIIESGLCPNCLVARLVQDNLLQPVSPEKFGHALFWAEWEHVEAIVSEFSQAAFGVRHGFVHIDGGDGMRDPCAVPAHAAAKRQLTAAIVRSGGTVLDEHNALPDWFQDPHCRRIVAAAIEQHGTGHAFDEIMLAPHLDGSVRDALADMIEEMGDASLVPGYARLLREAYLKRGLRAITQAAEAAAASSSEEAGAIIDQIHSRLDELAGPGSGKHSCSAGEAVYRAVAAALEAKRSGVPPGLRTGIAALDEIKNPLRPGELIIIGAGTSMGKTALAGNIGTNLARQGTGVSFVSLEMSSDDIGNRLLAGETGIPVSEIVSGRLSQDEVERLESGRDAISGWPLQIEAAASLAPEGLIRIGRHHKRKYGIEIVIVDYLGLMRGKGKSLYEQVCHITRGLKIAAVELELPIIALAQLNREVEHRANGAKYKDRYLKRRPKLTDLRESGSIEQDADSVIFLHREEVCLAREKPPMQDVEEYADWNAAICDHRGRADLIVAKQRQGRIGLTSCAYDAVRFKFGGHSNG